jgi:hypothetical protein
MSDSHIRTITAEQADELALAARSGRRARVDVAPPSAFRLVRPDEAGQATDLALGWRPLPGDEAGELTLYIRPRGGRATTAMSWRDADPFWPAFVSGASGA